MPSTLRMSDSFSDILECLYKIVTSEDTFLDIGANEGLISCWVGIKNKPKRIIAVEGNKYFMDIMEGNFEEHLGGIPHEMIFRLALDYTGTHHFYEPPGSPSQSSIFDRFSVNK